MKRFVYGTAILCLGIGLLLPSCSKEELNTEGESVFPSESKSEFDYGAFHNDFLDLVYTHQSGWHQLEPDIQTQELLMLLQDYASNGLPIGNDLGAEDLINVNEWIHVSLDEALLSVENLSLRQAYDDLYSAVFLTDNSQQFKSRVQRILSHANDNMSEEELAILEVAVEISIASYEYWEDYESNDSKISDKAKHVIGGDVSGVVTGAIGGAVTGGPIGALLGASLGAPLGSCYAAIEIMFW